MERITVRPRNLTAVEADSLGKSESDRLRVLDPQTKRPLADEGQTVTRSTYWTRRLLCGDVEPCAVVKPVEAASGKASRARSGAKEE